MNTKVEFHCPDDTCHPLAEEVAKQLVRNQPGRARMDLYKKRKNKKGGKKRNIELYTCLFDGETFFVKHYFERKLVKRLSKMVTGPEGLRCYKIAQQLSADGIPVAEPVAAMIYRAGPVNADSIFIVRRVEGLNLKEVLHRNHWSRLPARTREAVWIQLARMWARLLNGGYVHQDAHIGNFILSEGPDDPRMVLVDMDNIHHYPFTPLRVRLHSLARFHSSLTIHLERAGYGMDPDERTLFFQECCAGLQTRTDPETLQATIPRMTARKVARRKKNRARKLSKRRERAGG